MKNPFVSTVHFRFTIAACLVVGGTFAAMAGCSSSDSKDTDSTPVKDGGSQQDTGTGNEDSGSPEEDAGSDAGSGDTDAGDETDAGDDAGEADAGPQGCALFPAAAFCDDFDDPDALTQGKTKWDFLEQSTQPILTLSTEQKVSAPQSLLTRVIDGSTPGAKFSKLLTKANFSEVTWEYDVNMENVGTADGFFADDFQFSDSGGTDSFGWRLVVLTNAASIGTLRVEHNAGAIGGDGGSMEDGFPTGTVKLGQWHHVKQHVKFTFANGGNPDSVDYEIFFDGTSALKKTYPGLPRDKATLVRFAGMPFIFNKASSAGLKIFWDNQKVDIQ